MGPVELAANRHTLQIYGTGPLIKRFPCRKRVHAFVVPKVRIAVILWVRAHVDTAGVEHQIAGKRRGVIVRRFPGTGQGGARLESFPLFLDPSVAAVGGEPVAAPLDHLLDSDSQKRVKLSQDDRLSPL